MGSQEVIVDIEEDDDLLDDTPALDDDGTPGSLPSWQPPG